MKMIQDAFKELWPERELEQEVTIKYSGKFSDYNANVKYTPWKMSFKLSKAWKGVDEQIIMGLIQNLLIKMFKRRYGKYCENNKVQMYENFLKNVAITAPRTESHPELVDAFNRVNEGYFNGLMDMPNLQWGQDSFAKLGSYEYGNDTVTITNALREAPHEMMDYVIYHELLHKKHKFYHKNGRSFHHTTIFRQDEKRFRDAEKLEQDIKIYLRPRRAKKAFLGLFRW